MTEKDKQHLETIRQFLREEEINFTEETIHTSFPNGVEINDYAFYLTNGEHKMELRYVNSYEHKTDFKRFDIKGIPANYYSDITEKYLKEKKRLIWIQDFEMEEKEDVKQIDGSILHDWHRKWEVLQSYILAGIGKLKRNIYARDCNIREVITTGSNNEATPFLKTHCFYGNRAATKTYGLFLKKEKAGLPAGTLVMLMSFGLCFYGNKNKQGHPDTEVIRVGTYVKTRVVGGSSKLLTHFLRENPTLTKKTTGEEFEVDGVTFYVDISHNDANSMETLGYKHVMFAKGGTHNLCVEDISSPFVAKAGDCVMRKPAFHQEIMELIREGKIVAVPDAGTDVYSLNRKEYLEKLDKGEIF